MALLSVTVPRVSQVVVASIVVLGIYAVALAIYRLFFHPLAKYPGRLQYKLSSWPLVYQAYTGDRHIWHLKDHEKYGPVVRIAPNTLSFNTASALHTIYGARNANVKKAGFYKTVDVAAGAYSSFTETDREKHAAKRRWMGPVFSADSVKQNEAAIVDVVEQFCETLRPGGTETGTGQWGPKWNASELTTYLGFDIMGSLIFGHDFQSVQRSEHRDLADSILPTFRFLNWVSHLPMAVLIRPFMRTRLFEMAGGKPVADNNRLIDYASREVEARIANTDSSEKEATAGRLDFLSRLVQLEDKRTGWRPTPADLNTECLNMMNAGADPYSGVIAGAIFYLVHNADVLQKATAEVRATFSSTSDIHNGPALNSCTYLYACIEETLRRTAPVPSHLPRAVLAGGLSIDGHDVPARTEVGVSTYALHHEARYFEDPWVFKPERWIESAANPPERIAHARKAFAPFQLGSRQCSGKHLAYLQLKLTLAHVLWRFELRVAPGEMGRGAGGKGLGVGRERVDEFQLWDAFGFARDGPMVEVRDAHY
ncbi:cytochrome P450 [Massariosphaeria phaeospora]|uniref:Cytochrome P450 n=1 Tax=Massariosphaeria phaeospora TaxID=100035 RepID=A0A7C8MDV4_9PLEO|nr:cytochrome P450 [Massariosphaeria phaeospora]